MSLRKLGRYDIVRVLGKGAMGIVYEGRDPNLDRRVAIKTVKVENLAPEAAAEYEARFRTEARSAARLQHPNIVSVYDSDRHEDVAYLVMEYIQGDDLKQHLDSGQRYSLEQSLQMIGDLLSALDYAHRHGVVHRDIKPANLLLEATGRVKLTDFGVARMQDADATRTQGAMVGTLKYMSPEQVQGQKVDTRADLFSVGVLLYQLLTDRRPFDGENEFAIIHQIVGHTPPPPSSIDARLPAAIDAVVARALAKKPEERFPTAGEFAAALHAAVRHADDPTIVPPANPARSHASFQSMTSPGTSPMGNSTVTQELELVYWKDVKDSADREDLEVFLAKFPAGIYADLARRRLRKLAAGPVLDQTVLSGMTPERRESAARASGREDDTLTIPQRRPAGGDGSVIDVTAPRGTSQSAPADETTVPLETTAPLATAAPLVAAASAAPAARAALAPQMVRERRLTPAVLAGAAAVIVAGMAALLMLGRGGNESESAAATAASAASAASAAAPAAAPAAPAAAPAAAPQAIANAPQHPRVVASHPKRTLARSQATTATPVTATVSSTAARSIAEAPPPPEPRDPVRAAGQGPARTAAASPVDACKDKMFLSLEFCLAEQCDKPGARSHPLCVKYREEKRLREESRIRN